MNRVNGVGEKSLHPTVEKERTYKKQKQKKINQGIELKTETNFEHIQKMKE